MAIGWLTGRELCIAYHAAKTLVVPSLYLDPLPTVVLEAMASAKPVIAAKGGGVHQVVIHGQDGYIVEKGNALAIAKKVRKLFDSPENAARVGEMARNKIIAKFSLDKMLESFVSLMYKIS